MDLRRINLDKRARKEVRLLLVVSLDGDSVARFEQSLQCLDHGSGFQNKSLHPGREPGQARGLLRLAARPSVRLSGELNGSIHLIPPGKSNIPSAPARQLGTELDMDRSPFLMCPSSEQNGGRDGGGAQDR